MTWKARVRRNGAAVRILPGHSNDAGTGSRFDQCAAAVNGRPPIIGALF